MQMSGDSRPIWIQLVEEFTQRIVSGQWKPGEKVPSVRELAAEFTVNPNTVQRALTLADEDGLTQSNRTAGRFVTDDQDVIKQHRDNLAHQITAEFIAQMKALGCDKNAITELINSQWNTYGPDTVALGNEQKHAKDPHDNARN